MKPVAASAAVSREPPTPQVPGLFHDEGLLENARTKWQYAEWQDLIALDPEVIAGDPDRAKLALLVAAAHSHAGEMAQAKRFARQALAWGCGRELAARVLISAVHNSLGRVAACLDEEEATTRHFERAVRFVEPRADAALLGRTRRIRETARLGLLSEATGLIQKELGLETQDPVALTARFGELKGELALIRHQLTRDAHRERQTPPVIRDVSTAMPAPDAATKANPLFSAAAFGFYTGGNDGAGAPYVYVDSKSLPRSGLHYMRNSLHEILGSGFSFCEWYSEPGCCRQMPCTLCPPPGSPKHFRLRFVKSHDRGLKDPAFPLVGALRRIILVRDPLFILTSWWSLQTLEEQTDLLGKHGIKMAKINYLHEKSLVARAHAVVDQHGSQLERSILEAFLKAQSDYIVGFVAKWAVDGNQLVPYAQVPHVVCDLLSAYEDTLAPDARDRLERFKGRLDSSFQPRASPFEGPSPSLTEYLQDHADLFRRAAASIIERDRTGILARM